MFKKLLILLVALFWSTSIFAAPGEGTVAWEPATMTYGDTGVFLSITYTAGATAWSAGTLVFIVPDEFPLISLTPGIAGYVTMTSTDLGIAAPVVDGRAVTFTVSALDATTGTLHLLYDNLVVPIAGTYNFNVLTGPEAVDAPSSIAVEPDVEVLDPTATVTETITETVTETITETVTETVTPTITQTVTQTATPTTTPTVTTLNYSSSLWSGRAWETIGNTYMAMRQYYVAVSGVAGYGKIKAEEQSNIFYRAGKMLVNKFKSLTNYNTNVKTVAQISNPNTKATAVVNFVATMVSSYTLLPEADIHLQRAQGVTGATKDLIQIRKEREYIGYVATYVAE